MNHVRLPAGKEKFNHGQKPDWDTTDSLQLLRCLNTWLDNVLSKLLVIDVLLETPIEEDTLLCQALPQLETPAGCFRLCHWNHVYLFLFSSR